MSVLICGMEMPTSCAVCPFENYGDCYGGKVKSIMDIDDYVFAGKRHPKCPLVPVPPHGRLIDADALPWIEGRDENDNPVYLLIKNCMDVVPTIIPEEPPKEEA